MCQIEVAYILFSQFVARKKKIILTHRSCNSLILWGLIPHFLTGQVFHLFSPSLVLYFFNFMVSPTLLPCSNTVQDVQYHHGKFSPNSLPFIVRRTHSSSPLLLILQIVRTQDCCFLRSHNLMFHSFKKRILLYRPFVCWILNLGCTKPQLGSY